MHPLLLMGLRHLLQTGWMDLIHVQPLPNFIDLLLHLRALLILHI
jgi:hypothetical protein